MLKHLLVRMWFASPERVRRLGVWLAEPRFTVTVGAVVLDGRGRVLLLKHVFRKGSGWGIPGGFIEKGEQPEEAIRRELREEAGLEVGEARVVTARTLRRPRQIEILFLARASRGANARVASTEISHVEWFATDALPDALGKDQRRLIRRALESGAQSGE